MELGKVSLRKERVNRRGRKIYIIASLEREFIADTATFLPSGLLKFHALCS
jgi:hypothetical protein